MTRKLGCLAIALVAFLICSPGLLSTIILLAAVLVAGFVAMDYAVRAACVRVWAGKALSWLRRRWGIDEH